MDSVEHNEISKFNFLSSLYVFVDAAAATVVPSSTAANA